MDFGLGTKTAYVYGLGTTGKGAARALQQAGVQVAVWDDRFWESVDANLPFDAVSPMKIDWKTVGALIKSPGISMETPVVQAALAAGVPVMGDVDLLARREKNNAVSFIGITGTNGKSTTTALIGHILKESGRKVAVGGNIGTAALQLPELPSGGIYVLELSSYQLDMMRELRVDGGVFLNLTPDHLARHHTMEGYLAAKMRLFQLAKPDATRVLGVDQPCLADVAASGDYTTVAVRPENQAQANVSVRDGAIWRGGEAQLTLADFPHLPGPHNAQNIACALALLVPRWVTLPQFIKATQSFKGLPHRLEDVATVAGIRFVNDSKATNGDSAVYALQSFPHIYWICGGQPKTDGLGDCVQHLEAVRAAFTIGEAGADFAHELKSRNVPAFVSGTLEKAVADAFATARTEGIEHAVVLLSPAAASWDQFRSFEHRGDVFVNLVRALSDAARSHGGH